MEIARGWRRERGERGERGEGREECRGSARGEGAPDVLERLSGALWPVPGLVGCSVSGESGRRGPLGTRVAPALLPLLLQALLLQRRLHLFPAPLPLLLRACRRVSTGPLHHEGRMRPVRGRVRAGRRSGRGGEAHVALLLPLPLPFRRLQGLQLLPGPRRCLLPLSRPRRRRCALTGGRKGHSCAFGGMFPGGGAIRRLGTGGGCAGCLCGAVPPLPLPVLGRAAVGLALAPCRGWRRLRARADQRIARRSK